MARIRNIEFNSIINVHFVGCYNDSGVWKQKLEKLLVKKVFSKTTASRFCK